LRTQESHRRAMPLARRQPLDAGGILAAGVHQAGSWVWSDPDTKEVRSAIGYEVITSQDGTGSVRLQDIRSRPQESIASGVLAVTTRPHLGGLRWWFVCPLIVRGRECWRRCGKLYLHGRYFGCRLCQDLTYRSCQEAHQEERSRRWLRHLEAELGLLPSDPT